MRMRLSKRRLLILSTCGLFGVIIFLLIPLSQEPRELPDKFVVSVDPVRQEIVAMDGPEADYFFDNPTVENIRDVMIENVASVNNAINPAIKYVHITSGLRKEQIADRFANVLGWSAEEKAKFIALDHPTGIVDPEGYYFPGTYTVHTGETSASVSEKMFFNFEQEVEARFATSTTKMISLDTALKIASLIEREAAGKHDMRLISGIIWNRMFSGMNLEIDATLQYAKGTSKNWWPQVVPKDKYINSPYNTYKYKGFPPTPIANPGLASIQAALNPEKTDCLFYIHDTRRRIHCAKTYTQHKRNIAIYY